MQHIAVVAIGGRRRIFWRAAPDQSGPCLIAGPTVSSITLEAQLNVDIVRVDVSP